MVNLQTHNTLRVGAHADDLLELNSPQDITKLNTNKPFVFLGLGANVLFTKDFPGTVVKVNFSGIKVIKDTENEVFVECAAGQNWHDLVMWSVGKNLSGLEDMALIPGTVGAAVVGNIAAYGQNQAEIVEQVEVYDLENSKTKLLSSSECEFKYRESAFKHQFKNKYLITKVVYRLSKSAHFDISYYSRTESLENEIKKIATPPYRTSDVAQAVINIRTQKMPDWNQIGTAGSFFKNPFITKQQLTSLQSIIPDIQFYPVEKMLYPKTNDPALVNAEWVKIPAGRLLDELGWRGKRIGNVGTFAKHALVIVTYPGATGKEVYEFSENMRSDVKNNFGLTLEYEVQII